ncbi:hypothetical protein [Chitinophaga caseinilytica]|uniref:hypothetical protein n=1 Tax=Chitinophaga caseinilytica TaxID=2267521 RepID=UPI003C2E2F9C
MKNDISKFPELFSVCYAKFRGEEKFHCWLILFLLHVLWFGITYLNARIGGNWIFMATATLVFLALCAFIVRDLLRTTDGVLKLNFGLIIINRTTIEDLLRQQYYERISKNILTWREFLQAKALFTKPEKPQVFKDAAGWMGLLISYPTSFLSLYMMSEKFPVLCATLQICMVLLYLDIMLIVRSFRKWQFERRMKAFLASEVLQSRLEKLPAEMRDTLPFSELMIKCGLLASQEGSDDPRSSLLQTL